MATKRIGSLGTEQLKVGEVSPCECNRSCQHKNNFGDAEHIPCDYFKKCGEEKLACQVFQDFIYTGRVSRKKRSPESRIYKEIFHRVRRLPKLQEVKKDAIQRERLQEGRQEVEEGEVRYAGGRNSEESEGQGYGEPGRQGNDEAPQKRTGYVNGE